MSQRFFAGKIWNPVAAELGPLANTQARQARSRSSGNPDYFKPSFFPAASRRIDCRMRLSRVSGRLAI